MERTDLAAAIRTTSHAATYLRELKGKAAALTSKVAAERRGYFTPGEEEATLGLLVSYWQTRNALYDLLCSLRQEFSRKIAPRTTFLIGFASAAVLIDAARFLRELAATRPIVREKLNETAEQFGIPRGVYDTVQKSLLSARNGWHLLDAINGYRRYVELQSCDWSDDEKILLEIIEPLVPQLEVSVARFAASKLKTRTGQIGRNVKELFFSRTLYRLQRFTGTLLSNKFIRYGHQPGLPGDVGCELRKVLKPGDVLVVRKEYALTNYFLPGYWPHAALYLGTRSQFANLEIENEPAVLRRQQRLDELSHGDAGLVLEAMKDGVQLRTLESPFGSDSVIVLRPNLATHEIALGIARVFAHEAKPYDFDFDFRRSDRLVCTEVVYRAFDGLGNVSFPLVQRAGRPTLSGSDLIGHAIRRELFSPVAAFAPLLVSGIRYSDDVLNVLRAGQTGAGGDRA